MIRRKISQLYDVKRQMMVGEQLQGEVSAMGLIAIAAGASDAGDLDRPLVEVNIVGLIGDRRRVVAADRDVDGRIDRHADIGEAPGGVAATAIAGAVGTRHDHAGTDRFGARRQEPRIAARGGVPVSPVTADPCDLNGGLIDVHDVRLVGLGARIRACHRDVDRVVESKCHMCNAPGKGSVAAAAGAVSASRDHVGADQAVQGMSQSEDLNGPARRRVVIAAIASDARHLGCALIEKYRVRLMRVGRSVRASNRDVDRMEDGGRAVDHHARKGAVAATSGMVAAGAISLGPAQLCAGDGSRMVTCPPVAELPLPPLPPVPAI